MAQVPPTLLAQASACATGMKPALRAALGGGKVSAGVGGAMDEYMIKVSSPWGCLPI